MAASHIEDSDMAYRLVLVSVVWRRSLEEISWRLSPRCMDRSQRLVEDSGTAAFLQPRNARWPGRRS